MKYKAKEDRFARDEYGLLRLSTRCFIKDKEYSEVDFEYEGYGYVGLIDEQGDNHLTERMYFTTVP